MKIKIVGWAGVNHSYSIAGELYAKGLLMNPSNQLFFTPFPFYNPNWKKSRSSLFDSMKKPPKAVDVTFRVTYPYDLEPDPHAHITMVFMTCEFNVVSDPIKTQLAKSVWIVTPSEYSKKGIVTTGVDANHILVVPHCYEYQPCRLTSDEIKGKLGIPKEDKVFFHNSALTGNKNLSDLLQAFEQVYRHHPQVSLLIKGLDNTYQSCRAFNETKKVIQCQLQLTGESKIYYQGQDATEEQMSEYYHVCDCYVSPFLAEGFNLPVLEALCHGKEVICTRGGPPDEFAPDAHFIQSKVVTTGQFFWNGTQKTCLVPDLPNLYQLMLDQVTGETHPPIDVTRYRQQYSCQTIGKRLEETFQIHLGA